MRFGQEVQEVLLRAGDAMTDPRDELAAAERHFSFCVARYGDESDEAMRAAGRLGRAAWAALVDNRKRARYGDESSLLGEHPGPPSRVGRGFAG